MHQLHAVLIAVLVGASMVVLPTLAWSETLLERGRYLMQGIVACGNCHTPKERGKPIKAMELAGGFVIEEPPFTAVASNITPDKATGIGTWTDAQLIRAIREGVRPDGSIIGPPMPIGLYRRMSDRDVQAIVAYLRQVKPITHSIKKSVYRISLPTSYGPALEPVAEVARDNRVEYGAYLAGPLGHCVTCHTPMGPSGRRDYGRLGAGGFPFHGPWGTIFSANITPDPDTGIGKWTDAEIKRAITHGIGKQGEPMLPPMAYAWYRNISATDLNALVAYLRSLKPLPAFAKSA